MMKATSRDCATGRSTSAARRIVVVVDVLEAQLHAGDIAGIERGGQRRRNAAGSKAGGVIR